VTLRTARYRVRRTRGRRRGAGEPRWRRYTVYIFAGLAMVAAGSDWVTAPRPPRRSHRHPEGVPFLARLVFGRRVAMLVHHCHREQWPVARRFVGRLGWFVDPGSPHGCTGATSTSRCRCRRLRDLTDLGVDAGRVAVVRNGLDTVPPDTLDTARSMTLAPWCCPAWFRTQIEDALDAVALLRPRVPEFTSTSSAAAGGGPTRRAGRALGITDAVVPATSTTPPACSGATILGPFCRRARRLGRGHRGGPARRADDRTAPPAGSPARSSTA
jgi:hypothetical protein